MPKHTAKKRAQNKRKRSKDLLGSVKSPSLARMIIKEKSGLGSSRPGAALAGAPRRRLRKKQ